MPSTKQDEFFAEEIKENVEMSRGTLDNAIAWMNKNLDPDDVFDEKKLEEWAERNGYTKP